MSSARCPAMQAATADLAPANAKNNPSPSESTSTPPWLATAPRRSSRCLSSTPAYRSPIRRSNRVDPSMSVNTKVTVPPGKGVSTRSRTGSPVPRAERHPRIPGSDASLPAPCGSDFSSTMTSRAYKPTAAATGPTEFRPDPAQPHQVRAWHPHPPPRIMPGQRAPSKAVCATGGSAARPRTAPRTGGSACVSAAPQARLSPPRLGDRRACGCSRTTTGVTASSGQLTAPAARRGHTIDQLLGSLTFRFSGASAASLRGAGRRLIGQLAAETMARGCLMWPDVCRHWLPVWLP